MPLFYKEIFATARVLLFSENSFSETINLKYKPVKRLFNLRLSLCLEFKTPKLAKVKAHTRVRNGHTVKVRSYFRRLRDLR